MASDIVLTNPDTMAQPGGHYTHAVTANGFVFIAGQLPIALGLASMIAIMLRMRQTHR